MAKKSIVLKMLITVESMFCAPTRFQIKFEGEFTQFLRPIAAPT